MSKASRPHLAVGQALLTSLAVLARNLWPLLLLAAVGSIPNFLIDLVVPPQPSPWAKDAVPPGSSPADPSVGVVLLLFLATILLSLFFSAAVTYVTIADLRGNRPALRGAIASSFSVFPAILGSFFLVTLILFGIGFATMLIWIVVLLATGGGPTSPLGLIAVPFGAIPAIIVLTTFYVAIPAVVVERVGALASLRRSEELTKGNRWQIFALFIAVMATLAALSAIVYGFKVLVFGAHPGPAYSFLRYLALVPQAALSWVVIAVAYYYLRTGHESGPAAASR